MSPSKIYKKYFKINKLHNFSQFQKVPLPGLLSALCVGLLLTNSAMAQSRLLWACIGEGGKRNFYTSERAEAQGKDCLRIEEPVGNNSGSGSGSGSGPGSGSGTSGAVPRPIATPARGATAPGATASHLCAISAI
jgi:hypothetical protein